MLVSDGRSLEEVAAVRQEAAALIVAASTDAVVGKTLDGRITSWSLAAAALYGYSEAEALGQGIGMLVPDSERGDIDAILARVAEGETVVRARASRLRSDGEELDVALVVSPLHGPRGEVIGALEMAQDNTAAYRLEAQVRGLEKMEAVGQLTTGLAHDLNNLLTAIRGFGAMAQTSEDPDRRTALLASALAACDTATRLVRQVMMFVRQEDVTPRSLDLNAEIVSNVVLLRQLVQANVGIDLALGPGLPRATLDPSHVEQMLLNLAANARDAMPGGGTLTIGTRAADGALGPGKTAVEITVADTGSGMDAATRAHLFEPFYTSKPRGRGTGIGLATVARIVEFYAGRIDVESAVGRGTTFRIVLPCDGPALPEQAAAS